MGPLGWLLAATLAGARAWAQDKVDGTGAEASPPPIAETVEEAVSRLEEVDSTRPLELHTWVAVGYRFAGDTAGASEAQPYLSLARVQARVLEHGFGAFVQVAAERGTVELLDARSTWRPSPHFWLRGGRFKTPLSADYLIPGNHLLLPSRGLHLDLVTRRALGAEVYLRLPLGEGLLLFEPGVFDPVGGTTPTPGVGQQAVGRVLWQLPSGLQLHAATSAWLRDEAETAEAVAALGDKAPAHDRHLVGAVLFEDGVWTGTAEAVWARPADGSGGRWGASTLLARRFETSKAGIEVEPVLGLEALQGEAGREERGRLGLNIHHHDWRVVQLLAAEVTNPPGDGPTEWAGYLQIRAGM